MNISKRIICIINFQSFISDLFFHICLFTFVFLLLTSCETTEPPPSNQKLTLNAEDASCTEAWLNLKIENISLPTEIVLKQNDTTVITTNINSKDTTLFIENLLPNQTYTFQASRHGGQASIKIPVTTMDTTSHNFTWETFTFGGGGNSILRDVAIINENNIWAVGEIHTEKTDKFDSNGVWVQHYNAVHWDGEEWELKRIMFYTFCNQEHKSPYQARAIFAFSDGTIAVTSDSKITYIENGKQKNIECIPVSVKAIWGTSSKDFYVVGKGGNIAYYNGSSWTKIESGTDVDLVDIWGSSDGKKIWACGNDDLKPTVLLKIKNNTADILYSSRDNLYSYNFNQLSGNFRSVWTDSKDFLYILTSYDLYRIFNENIKIPKATWRDRENQIATKKVRGTSRNNIFSAGWGGLLSHYNGVNWKTYSEYNIGKTYKSITIKENIAVAVGNDYINGIQDKAIISITKK